MAFTPGTQTNVKSSGANTTFSHTVPAGTHRLLVLLHTKDIGTNPTFSPTYNGVALTQAEQLVGSSSIVTIWYLIDPPAGTYNIATTHGSTSTNRFIAMSWGCGNTPVFDAAASTTISATCGADDLADITITPSQSSSLIVDVMWVDNGNAATGRGASQSVIVDIDEGSYQSLSSYATGMASAPYVVSHTQSTWGGSAAYLAAAAVFYEQAALGRNQIIAIV